MSGVVMVWVSEYHRERARRSRRGDLCAACSVPRDHHGETGRTKHWFVPAHTKVHTTSEAPDAR